MFCKDIGGENHTLTVGRSVERQCRLIEPSNVQIIYARQGRHSRPVPVGILDQMLAKQVTGLCDIANLLRQSRAASGHKADRRQMVDCQSALGLRRSLPDCKIHACGSEILQPLAGDGLDGDIRMSVFEFREPRHQPLRRE